MIDLSHWKLVPEHVSRWKSILAGYDIQTVMKDKDFHLIKDGMGENIYDRFKPLIRMYDLDPRIEPPLFIRVDGRAEVGFLPALYKKNVFEIEDELNDNFWYIHYQTPNEYGGYSMQSGYTKDHQYPKSFLEAIYIADQWVAEHPVDPFILKQWLSNKKKWYESLS